MDVVTITLGDGKERHLKMTMLGMKRFKEAMGVPVSEATKLPPDDVAGAMCWACLVWEEPTLTLDAVLAIIDVRQLNDIMKAITEVTNLPLADSPTSG